MYPNSSWTSWMGEGMKWHIQFYTHASYTWGLNPQGTFPMMLKKSQMLATFDPQTPNNVKKTTGAFTNSSVGL